jgi:hypothetical protein
MKFTGIRNKYLFLCLALSFCGIPGGAVSLKAQDSAGGYEKIYMHINKPVYIAGEMLRYRVFTFNKSSGNSILPSRILYFDLTDYKGNTALQWRINLDCGDNSGSCRLPADLPGGVYTLTAYTSRMRNDPYETLYSQNIIISNLSNEFPDTLYIPVLNRQEAFTPAFQEFSGILPVETGASYSAGDTAETVIRLGKESTGDTASLSISVYLSVPLADAVINDSLGQLNRIMAGKDASGHGSSGRVYPLEDKSYILSGFVKSRSSNSPIAGGSIILAVTDSLFPHIRYSRTDASGRFLFYLDRWFDNKELILQKAGEAIEGGIIWEIERKKLQADGRPIVPYAVNQRDANSVTTLNESRLIESVYSVPLPAKPSGIIPPGANYFGPADISVKPGDFSELVNMKEITENILQGVRFVGRSNTYAFQVYNEKSGQWPESDMILLNGVPFYDMNYIATLGTKDINRIEVITGNFILGDLTLEGLVSIYTHDRKIPQTYLKNRSFIVQNTVIPPDIPLTGILPGKPVSGTSHDPDFRVNLLWEPDREITVNGKLVLRFPVSLITGTYDIVVKGITQKGTVLSGKASFDVK